MPKALLIVFEYSENRLGGAVVDTYRAYSWCRSFGCHPAIITDFKFEDRYDVASEAVKAGVIDEAVFSFCKKAPHSVVVDEKDFLHAIRESLATGINDGKLIVYYSGHGKQESFVLPNDTKVSFMDIRNEILGNVGRRDEVFWIMDCCNPNGLRLPYKLHENFFSLGADAFDCVSQDMILLTSSNSKEKSAATKYGSVFSRHLFPLLRTINQEFALKNGNIPAFANRNLDKLASNLTRSIEKMQTGYKQTVCIFSAYPIHPVLWPWVGSREPPRITVDDRMNIKVSRPSPP